MVVDYSTHVALWWKDDIKACTPCCRNVSGALFSSKQHIVMHRDTVMWWGQLLTLVKRVQYSSERKNKAI